MGGEVVRGQVTVRISFPLSESLKRLLLPVTASSLWMWFVYYASTATDPAGSTVVPQNTFIQADLVAHFGLYLVMAALLRWVTGSLPGHGAVLATLRILVPLTFSVALGGMMELSQRGVSGRSAEWADAIANGLGAVMALVLIEAALLVRRLRVQAALRHRESVRIE